MKKPSNNHVAYLGFFLFYAIFYGLQILQEWPGLEVTRGPAPLYWDLQMTLVWGECLSELKLKVYEYIQGDSCTGYIYGRSLVWLLHTLQLSANATYLLGNLTAMFLCSLFALLTYYFWKSNSINPILVISALISPGIWLLIASGNLDSVMFSLLLSASYIFKKNYFLGASLLIFASVLFKFYTFPLLLFYFLLAARKYQKFIIPIILTIGLAVILMDLKETDSTSPGPNNYFFTFGIHNFSQWLEIFLYKLSKNYYELPTYFSYSFGILLVLCISLWYRIHYQVGSGSIKQEKKQTGFTFSESLLLNFGVVYLSLYFQGSNYDYKLVFYIVSVLAMNVTIDFRLIPRNIKPIFLISLWLTCFSFGFRSSFTPTIDVSPVFVVFQFIGDLLNLYVTSILLIHILRLISRKGLLDCVNFRVRKFVTR